MKPHEGLLAAFLAILLMAPSALALAQRPDTQGPAQVPTMRGADLLTPAEIADFCARMEHAQTPDARRMETRRLRGLMRMRATERGVRLSPGDGTGRPGMGNTACMARPGQTDAVAAIGLADAGVAAPHEQLRDGIAYLSGGIGADEASAMRLAASRYSLRLTFTGRHGEFLSDVATEIFREGGNQVFSVTSEGPFLFVRLPPWTYRVVTKADGVEHTDRVTVPARGGVSRTVTWTS